MRRIACLAAAALFIACLSPSPASIGSRLRVLVARASDCENDRCRGKTRAELMTLARYAARTAETTRDGTRHMALLRVTGVAAWQAGGRAGESLATRASEVTLGRCRSLDELARTGQSVGAPDDCVVLEALPALVAHALYRRELRSFEAAPPDAASAARLEALASQYPGATFVFLAEIGGRLRSYEGVSVAILEWLATTETALFCEFRRAREIGQRHWPEATELHRALERELRFGASAVGRDYATCAAETPIALPPDRAR